MSEFNESDAKQLATDLTETYAATVYGMAKGLDHPASSKVTTLKVKSITKDECKISLVTCSGDLCEMKNEIYKFRPPLDSVSKDVLDSRLPQIRDAVLAPNPLWLLKDPLALGILVTCSALGYGTFVLGTDGIVDGLARAPRLEGGVSALYGSSGTFANSVVGSFWFAVVAHGIEASIAVRHSLKRLRLGFKPTAMWSGMIFLVGYPVFSRFQKLVAVQEQCGSKSK